MSDPRDLRLTPAQLDLKAAFRAAVSAAGGQVEVAAMTGRAQSRVSDWCGRNTGAFAPLDAVAEVEDRAAGAPGWPHVTRALARRQGFELFAVPGVDHAPTDWSRRSAEIMREVGDLLSVISAALADDNDVDAAEARRIIPETDDAIARLVELRAMARARAEG